MNIRSICLLNRIHADCAAYLSSAAGANLRADDGAFIIDATPAASIEEIADYIFKNHDLKTFHYNIDGRGGWLGIKSPLNAELKNGLQDIYSLVEEEIPQVNAIQSLNYCQINHLSEEHAKLHQNLRQGVKPEKGNGWMVIDIVPATTALWLANEIVTTAQVAISDIKYTGSAGKVFLIGEAEQLSVVKSLLDVIDI